MLIVLNLKNFAPRNIVVAGLSVCILSACSSNIFGSASVTDRNNVDPRRDYTPEQIVKPMELIPGDRFKLDNPVMTWTVLGQEGDQVLWKNDLGAEKVSTDNPLLPVISWKSADSTGKRLLSNISGSFFPLEIGAQVQFKSTVSIDKPPYSWEFDWNCLVAGETRVNLPVGAFDTFRVECSRQQPEIWTFYYAPRLGYYVMMEQVGRTGGAPIRRILTGYERGGVVVGDLEQKEPNQVAAMSTELPPQHEQMQSKSDELAPPPVVMTDGQIQSENVVMADKMEGDAMLAPVQVETVQESESSSMASQDNSVISLLPGDQNQAVANTNVSASESNEDIMALKPDDGNVQQAAVVSNVQTAGQAAAVASAANTVIPAGYYVRLASYRNPANVDRGWTIFTSQHSEQLSDLFPYKQEVNVSGKGVFTRLLAGPLPSQSSATNRCNALKDKGQYCTTQRQQ